MKREVLGRIVPVLLLTGVGLVLVGIGVLPDDLTTAGRIAVLLGGVALVALSVRWFPYVRDRYR